MKTNKTLKKAYSDKFRYKLFTLIICLILLVVFSVVGIFVGAFDTSPKTMLTIMKSHIFTDMELTKDLIKLDKVIMLLRVPRVLLAIFAGICLAVSGTALQGISRNPLVSPFTIGLSSAAAFGASIAIVLGIGFSPSSPLGIVINAFIASILCAAIVYLIAYRLGMTSSVLVLIGVAVSYLFSALTATVQFIADENQLAAIVNWTFGSLNGATWDQVKFVGLVTLICLPILMWKAWHLNVIAVSSDDFTKSVGINPSRLRLTVGMASVLMAAATISFTGIIGFVGLIAPHIARMIVGNDHRYLIPLASLIGAILIVLGDIIGRVIMAPVTIPVGIIISFIGVPLFINLIYLRRSKTWNS